jgi:hypothetical protein
VKQLPGYASRYGGKHVHGYYSDEKRSVFAKMFGRKRSTETV